MMYASRVLSSSVLFLLLVVCFQNCSRVDHSSTNQQTAGVSHSGTDTQSNGDPYYGKPYDNGTGCAGPDTVRSRISYISATKAYLVKDECKMLTPPAALQPSDFQLDAADPNLLHYSGRSYIASSQALLVQNFETGKNPATISVSGNFTSATAKGNLLVCFVIYKTGTSVAAVLDSQGDVFSRALGPAATVGAAAGSQSEVWYAQNIANGTTSVTATFNANVGGPAMLACQEYSGILTSGALDGAVSSSGLTPGGGTAVIGPVSTTAAGDLLVAGLWHASSAPTPGPGFTLISNYSLDIYMYGNSADAGSYTATVNGVGDWLGFVLAFKTK